MKKSDDNIAKVSDEN
jgi:chromosome segregation ATPase